MTPQQVIEAIQALADVVKANGGLLGSDRTCDMANDKIRQLIPLLPTELTPPVSRTWRMVESTK